MKAAIEQDDVTGDVQGEATDVEATDAATESTQSATPASQSGAAAEYLHIPIGGRGSMVAAIFLRSSTDESLDSNDGPATRWESKGYWNGTHVFYGGDYINRLYAIEDAARAIGVKAAESTKKAEKKAAQEIMAWLEKMDTENDDGPEGTPCVWPASKGEMLAHEEPGNELDEDIPAGYHRCPGGIAKDGECECCGDKDQPSLPLADQPADVPPAALAGEGESAAPIAEPPDAVRQFEQRIAALSRELVAAVLDRVPLENKLKTAKSLEKEIIGEIQSASARGPERLPLFDSSAETTADDAAAADHPTSPQAGSEATSAGDQTAAGAGVVAPTTPPSPPDAWRSTPIDALGLPPKLAEKLAENDITTIGQLEDKRAEFGGLRSIKGIGPAKVDAIETAVIDWLTKNRDAGVFAGTNQPAAEGTVTA